VVARRILIVEDERLIALDLQRRLTRLGYTVVGIMASGPQAITAAYQLQPDVVLMDIRLQGEMDGIEAALRIQADRPVPIIYLTAYVDEATMQRAQATFPWGFLRKPFHVTDLQTLLARNVDELPRDRS
jgi:two-component system, cell cycle sensor histidine kinase and response regulator CckA